jgi:hypothetical protein
MKAFKKKSKKGTTFDQSSASNGSTNVVTLSPKEAVFQEVEEKWRRDYDVVARQLGKDLPRYTPVIEVVDDAASGSLYSPTGDKLADLKSLLLNLTAHLEGKNEVTLSGRISNQQVYREVDRTFNSHFQGCQEMQLATESFITKHFPQKSLVVPKMFENSNPPLGIFRIEWMYSRPLCPLYYNYYGRIRDAAHVQ